MNPTGCHGRFLRGRFTRTRALEKDFVRCNGHTASSSGAHFTVRLLDCRPLFDDDDSDSDNRTGAEEDKALFTCQNQRRQEDTAAYRMRHRVGGVRVGIKCWGTGCV